MIVSVLGTEYEIVFRREQDDPKLKECGGYCDTTCQRIVIEVPDDDPMNCENQGEITRRTIRHELVHAFAFESGLDANSEWAANEEMVSWVANQFPKLLEAFWAAGAM